MRTAKPCGPDAPRAGVKFPGGLRFPGAMVSKSRSPGRARHRPSNHCAGKAGVFPPNLSARVRYCLMPIAHETAGAARTRSSPRPLNSRARLFCKPRTKPCRENAKVCLHFVARMSGAICGKRLSRMSLRSSGLRQERYANTIRARERNSSAVMMVTLSAFQPTPLRKAAA